MDFEEKLCLEGRRLMKDIGKAWEVLENPNTTLGHPSSPHYKDLSKKEGLFSNHLDDCKRFRDACEATE